MSRLGWSGGWPVGRGAVVLVTGASQGIGEAAVRSLAHAGATVVLAARGRERLEAVRDSLPAGDHLALACDVRDPAAVRAAFLEVARRFGRLDGLVANAGVGRLACLSETGEDDLERMVATNVCGAIRCVREALPLLAAVGGRVVLVGSGSGRRGHPDLAVYSATKAALMGLADALRVELAPVGVRVSVVLPDRTRTPFLAAAGIPDEERGREPAVAARAVLRALGSGVPAVDCTRLGAARAALNALLPALCDRWIAFRTRKELARR